MTDEELMYASPEEWDFYNKCIEGLPKREGFNNNFWDKNGKEIPYGSSPHIAKFFRQTIDIVKPKSILEIGTCLGAGSSMWLNMCDAKVISVDISDREETLEAARILSERFGDRFQFFLRRDNMPIAPFEPGYFDLVWLDGGHDEIDVTKDLEWCLKLGIPYVLGDDFLIRFGPGVEISFNKFPELEMIKDMYNLKLFKNSSWEIH